jgi:hypothetical protein
MLCIHRHVCLYIYTNICLYKYTYINISPILLAALGPEADQVFQGAQVFHEKEPVARELSPGLNDGNTLYSLIYIYIYIYLLMSSCIMLCYICT